MIRKTGPDLLRQTLTRLWFFNIFVQKPYNLGFNYIYIFKLTYLINIFLGCFRFFRRNTNIRQITHFIKKNTYRLIEISTYKFMTFRIDHRNGKLILYVNINSRRTMYPKKLQTFNNSRHFFRIFKKKMKVFDYMRYIYKKNIYSFYFSNFVLQKKNRFFVKNILFFTFYKKFNKIYSKILVGRHMRRKKKIILKISKKKEAVSFFFITNRRKKENSMFLYTFLRRIILRNIKKKKKIIHLQNMEYLTIFDFCKFNKYKFFSFSSHIFNIFSKHFPNSKYTNKKWKILKNFFYLEKKKTYNNDQMLKLKYFFFSLTNYKSKIINLLMQNTIDNIFFDENINTISKSKKTIVKTDWIYNWKKDVSLNFKYLFIYSQFFNQIFDSKINNFLYFLSRKKSYKIFLKQEFSRPLLNKNLRVYEKNVLRITKFLKPQNHFYTNFINLIPSLDNYMVADFLAKQIAIELARTRKHWKVIRGIQLLLLQSYTQMRKPPFNMTSNIKGIQVSIRGRPNKISRTKRVVFTFGVIAKSSYVFSNAVKFFAKSNAQIGSFGIHVTIVS